MSAAAERYVFALEHLPPSGGGGAHSKILSVANLGKLSGLSPDRIARDLALHVHGARRISQLEIDEAVAKAFRTSPPQRSTPRVRVNSRKLLAHILARGAGFTEEHLHRMSPIKIDWPRARDAVEALRHLYLHGDKIFIGEKFDSGAHCIRPAAEWIEKFSRGKPAPPHIIPNPLTGEQGMTKRGKLSFRADACVAKFRFVTVEFDLMPLEQQVQFWAGVTLDVRALIFSGSKSLHAWVGVDIADAGDWERRVEEQLFDVLVPLGADSTCKNEARLSRMPGHFRSEKQSFQRLLYLSPKGGPVQP